MSLFAVYFLGMSAFLLVIIGVLSNYITQRSCWRFGSLRTYGKGIIP
jgi:hypothetical protein